MSQEAAAAPAATTPRAAAGRVAKWLLDQGNPDDAVQVLTAWAVTGPYDLDGQSLLAEAMRINPGAPLARSAFERMEGIAGDHSALDAAITRYTAAEVARLDAEIKRPKFRRAQLGFNNNLKYKDAVFHVQTEDSGLDKPHIITHLFADGGRVIKSHKRTYAKEINRADVGPWVRALMKQQHMEIVLMLRDGKFDEILAGRAIGGLDTLEHAPVVDVRKIGKQKKDATGDQGAAAAAAAGAHAAEPSPPSVKAPPPAPVSPSKAPPKGKVHVRLHVVRSLSGGPDKYEPAGDELVVGQTGDVALAGERFCARSEALLKWKDGKLMLEDVPGGNGVFLRIRTPVEMQVGDEFIVGDQLIRMTENPVPDVGPGPGPTYFYSSPTWPSSFRLVQIYEGGQEGACIVARGTTVIVGSAIADMVIHRDPLVADQHCIVEEQAGAVVLTDLDSRTGVFVRIAGDQELVQGDEILVGRTRLMIDLAV